MRITSGRITSLAQQEITSLAQQEITSLAQQEITSLAQQGLPAWPSKDYQPGPARITSQGLPAWPNSLEIAGIPSGNTDKHSEAQPS